jgi:hypothetical protein
MYPHQVINPLIIIIRKGNYVPPCPLLEGIDLEEKN